MGDDEIDIKTLFLSSELDVLRKKTESIKILEKLNADIYLSPKGLLNILN